MEDITERISQARTLFGSMNKQLLSNKQIPIDFRRRLYQATAVNILLWRCESWALKEADRSKLEAFHHGCLRRMCGWTMWDVGCSRETDHERTRQKNCCKFTKFRLDDGNAKMPMAIQTQRNEGVKISEANTRRMVSNATTSREPSSDHTARIHKHPGQTRL
jgi:hypothetical protein